MGATVQSFDKGFVACFDYIPTLNYVGFFVGKVGSVSVFPRCSLSSCLQWD